MKGLIIKIFKIPSANNNFTEAELQSNFPQPAVVFMCKQGASSSLILLKDRQVKVKPGPSLYGAESDMWFLVVHCEESDCIRESGFTVKE